jgi:hypothetical protein
VPIAYGHGEFFIEFIYKALKSNIKIIELPYSHPPDIEGMSKTASSLLNFVKLGIGYFVRVIHALTLRN